MRPDSVPSRTPKGEGILDTYAHEISANQRHALLVVDGRTAVADLEKKAFWVSNLAATLEELQAMGLVQEIGPVTTEPIQAVATSTPMKVQLAAIAKEMLGNNAERIIKKIEETDGTAGALEQALLNCKKIIKLTISEELADTFLERGRKVIGK